MFVPGHPGLAMYGLAENGNGVVEIIAGMKDPGSTPERVIPGNQAIGRIVTKDIDGIKDPGKKSGAGIR